MYAVLVKYVIGIISPIEHIFVIKFLYDKFCYIINFSYIPISLDLCITSKIQY